MDAPDIFRRIRAKDAAYFSDDPSVRFEVGKFLGWVDSVERSLGQLSGLRECRDSVVGEGTERAVVLGMGGSSLSSLVWQSVAAGRGLELVVCDSTNPGDVARIDRETDYDRTVFIVASKSGSTVEPLAMEEFFWSRAGERLGSGRGRRFIAVTDPGSEMERRAQEREYRSVFLGEPTVGGRFSALSVFGLLPAFLAGLDAGAMLDAATDAVGLSGVERGRRWGVEACSGKLAALLVSESQDYPLCLWAEQLVGESTGKLGKGLLPVASMEQSWCETDRSVFFEPVSGGTDVGIAAEMWSLMFATAVAGRSLGVNPFDQPDVQSAKDVARRKLAEIQAGGRLDLRSTAVGLEQARSKVEEFLTGMDEPGYVAILGFVPDEGGAGAAFGRLQSAVMSRYGVPCTFGFGPRYLHSTGQFHKGGPPVGRFLFVTADHREDMEIPGMGATFGQLCGAQALGDMETLRSRGLPVLHVHLRDGEDLGGLASALGAG